MAVSTARIHTTDRRTTRVTTLSLALICGVFGLMIGSFLNVVIYRVPQHLSIVSPPSGCPNCHHDIRARDNIPVISWLILHGRCRDCRAPISWRYPAVELTTALLFAGVPLRLGRSWEVPAYCVFVAGVFALALIDVDTLTLPRSIVWTHLGLVLALLLATSIITHQWRDLITGSLCGLAWSGLYLAMFLIRPKLIGFGDVRFALVLGLGLGYLDLAYPWAAFFYANLVGILIVVILLATKVLRRDQPVPYGVFLAAGTLLIFYFGPSLVQPLTYTFYR
jgi:leader peptidase (prepilin peptidase) / N-methyltransferase